MCVCVWRKVGGEEWRGGGETTLNSHSRNVSIGEERNRTTARLEHKQTNKQTTKREMQSYEENTRGTEKQK